MEGGNDAYWLLTEERCKGDIWIVSEMQAGERLVWWGAHGSMHADPCMGSGGSPKTLLPTATSRKTNVRLLGSNSGSSGSLWSRSSCARSMSSCEPLSRNLQAGLRRIVGIPHATAGLRRLEAYFCIFWTRVL